MKRNASTNDYATFDGNPVDPFESLIEIYYQLLGYITSSNKAFLVHWEEFNAEKKEYENKAATVDIDLIAINRSETVIVQIAMNLQDKVGNEDKQLETIEHFKRVEMYLSTVKQYRWLLNDDIDDSRDREVRWEIVFFNGYKKYSKEREKVIELARMQFPEMTDDEIEKHIDEGTYKLKFVNLYSVLTDILARFLKRETSGRINNSIVRTIQALLEIDDNNPEFLKTLKGLIGK